MKRYNGLMALLLLFCLVACNETQEKFFDDTATLYFNLSEIQKDSIIWSFAKTIDQEHVVEIPLEIAGYKTDYDRYYKVRVNEELTTAKPGIHYKTLADNYVLPRESFTAVLPVTVYCKDLLLDSVAVGLQIDIVPSDDFANITLDRQTVRISVSNFLQKPSMWDNVYGRKYFGTYSKMKHKLILQVCHLEDLPPYGSATRNSLVGYGMVMKNYFEENYPVYDENNQIIEPNWNITY